MSPHSKSAPSFELAYARTVSSKEVFADGPTILVFFDSRGSDF